MKQKQDKSSSCNICYCHSVCKHKEYFSKGKYFEDFNYNRLFAALSKSCYYFLDEGEVSVAKEEKS